MNLDYVKPFANTSDLVNNTPNLDDQQAKQKEDERLRKRFQELKKSIS